MYHTSARDKHMHMEQRGAASSLWQPSQIWHHEMALGAFPLLHNCTVVQQHTHRCFACWQHALTRYSMTHNRTNMRMSVHTIYLLYSLVGSHTSRIHAVPRNAYLHGKETRMLKNIIRWLLPLLVLTLIAAYLIIGPLFSAHAASVPSHVTHPAGISHPTVSPNMSWHI